jgi:hypothetical protein
MRHPPVFVVPAAFFSKGPALLNVVRAVHKIKLAARTKDFPDLVAAVY